MKMFSILTLLIAVAFSFIVQASGVVLLKTDFIAASASVAKNGPLIVVHGRLNESGLNKITLHKNDKKVIEFDIGGIKRVFKLRLPLLKDDIEFGPFSEEDAKIIVTEINNM